MKLKHLWTLLLLLTAGTARAVDIVSDVTDDTTPTNTVVAGSQITAESQLVSGNQYLIYYVGNGSSAYMKDTGSAYTGLNDPNATMNAVYRFTDNGDGTWKVQNYATGKYWGTPTANANAYIASDNAGAWTLNFQSNSNVAPSCNGHSWNRSGSNIHPWSTGTANVNQFKIQEVTPSMALQDEFTDKDISVSAEAAASLQTGQWYVMFDRGANHGYLYENGENKLYNTATVPAGSATDNAKYLVRIVGWDNEYYLQTGLGNFFGNIQHNAYVPTTATATDKITIKKINDTDGHFYLMSAAGVVLDANSLEQGDATVVGRGTTTPTATGGNNDWAFFPIEFVDSWIPTTAEVYTINNTNTSRGAMMFNPESNYVWSSGKSGTFDATDPNCQWVIVPTGASKQYFIYNIGAGKFAIPSGTGSTASWIFSPSAVAVTLIKQNDGTFKIKTVTTDTYAAVSNGFAGPIINYNDVGGNFTITKVEGNQSAAVATALSKLADNVTPLTAMLTDGTDGWYIIRVKQHGTYADKYVYAAASEINNSGTYYPLTFEHGANVRPSISDATYLTRFSLEGNKLYWQLPNGKYLYGANSKFPVATTTKSTCSMDYTSDKGFRMWGGSRYAVPYYLSSQYFIGETGTATNAYYDIYPVDLAAAGLTAWQVTVEKGSDATQVSCSRNDIAGGTTVYNGGFFFLPTGTTPASSDFTMTGMLGCTVDADNHTITVEYDPELSLTSDDVVVKQGNQTAGQGNAMQALLRIKVKPVTDFQPTQFTVNLTGASNVDNVKVYYTYNDEIRASSAAPALLGTATAAEGEVAVAVNAPSVDAGTSLYYWITADVKSNATELATIDASLTSISYTNAYKTANSKAATVLDLTAQGNPDGEMCIFKTQSYPWTASHINTKYYRIPTIINTADGGILALTDDRYSNTNDLGSHKIDVVARKSMDGGITWGEPVTIAAGDGSSDAGYGYGDPAIVCTKSGKLICLMASGKNGFSSGMLHMGYSESTDNGATWSAVKDIYSDINKNGAALTSVFTTAGKGVTFSNGRVAFAMNGKTSSGTNEYVLYSDDEGTTWALTPAAFTGADESKLEIMNDNSLLVSVRRGGYNSMSNRGYNRTTGDASEDGINNWSTQGVWGNEMNANGCNADILYYHRATEGGRDMLLHTLTKSYSTYRKDLRLYASFDQGVTWKEVFQIQPGYAAYSSMQKLANGDLAIIFEDGSIGNQDKMDCYAINYLVLSKETLEAKIKQAFTYTATIISKGETNGSAPWGSWTPSSGWASAFTTNASSGLAGVVVSANGTVLNRETDYGQRVFCIKPSAAGATDEFTITAPNGYMIKKYSLGGFYYTSGEKYTLMSADGTITAEINKSSGTPDKLTVDDILAQSVTFKMKSNGTANTRYACITDFVVQLVKPMPIALNETADMAAVIADYDGELANVTMNRKIVEGFNTVAVPFDLSAGQVKAVFGEGAKVYAYSENSDDPNAATVNFNLVTEGTITANVPVLVKATATSTSNTIENVVIKDEAPVATGKYINFEGVYAPTTVAAGDYFVANDAIYKSTGATNMKAFRAFLNAKDGVGNVKMFIEDTQTGIREFSPSPATTGERIYNLAGQRLNKLQRGVNIVNDKKIIVK